MKKIFLLFVCVLPLLGCLQQATKLVRQTPKILERADMIKQAEDGDIEAQYDLGKNYCCGSGTFLDNGQALYWWCQAGRQGQKDALYEIGTLFENTRGLVGSEVPVDPARAYAFYYIAEQLHHKEAATARKNIEHKLTSDERRRGEEIIRHWPDEACELPSTLKPKPDPSLMIHDAKRRNTI